jgi:hypothetical protein
LCKFDSDGLNLRVGEVSEPVKQGSKWSGKAFDLLQVSNFTFNCDTIIAYLRNNDN